MKKIVSILLVAFIGTIFSTIVNAETISVETLGAEDITYYSAMLNGYISTESGNISSYGIEIWSDDTTAVKNQMGSGNVSGQFAGKVYLVDDTTYSYRAYAKDKSANYYYGEIKQFTTKKRETKNPPEIDFNISVENPENIDFASTPNKFFLNNLIVNYPDTLKLIAGNNFDGVDGIIGAGSENIFINQYFINKYYTDPVLKTLLTVFDGAVYNRDEFIWEGITSIIPDFVKSGIYNIAPDALKSTLNTIYGDMGVKRFNGAINSVISNDYTSSDKRTFGYDKSNYRIINALVDSTKFTNDLVKNYQDGKETIVEGIEDYQGYYFGTIAPQYYNVQNNFLQMNRYLVSNSKNMSPEAIAEHLQNMSEYSKEISSYEKLDFIDKTASRWKMNLEYSYYGKGISEALEKIGSTLDFATSSVATWKTLEQVIANREQLQGTFERLQSTTENKKLSATLDDYLYKMEAGYSSFLTDSIGNVYSAYCDDIVKKAVNETIEKTAKKIVAAENKVYAEMAVDGALAKANYLLIAADVGGMFSEAISGTKTYLEKAIEAKYLWNIENESKEMLQRDLLAYSENQTEKNAEAVLNDLYWIKALKLREITVVKDLYKANDSSWLALADKSLAELSDGVNELYVNQRDALINASLTETKYTSEPLTLENGETYTVMDYNEETGNSGAIKTSSGTTMLKNADARLAGGVNLKSGSTLTISASTATVYIPFVTMESNSKVIINGGKVTIGEFIQNGGTIIVAGDSIVDITGDVKFGSTVALENAKVNIEGNVEISANINIGEGTININGNVTQNSGSLNVENGILKVDGDYYAKQGTFNAGSGRTEIGGSFLAEKYNNLTCSKMDFYMKNDNAYMLVNGDFVIDRYYASSSDIIAGTLELKGNFTQRNSINNYALNYDSKYAFRASGTHRVVFSGEEEQTIYFETPTYSYFNIVEIKNEDVLINFTSAVHANNVKGNLNFSNTLTLVGSAITFECAEINGENLAVQTTINCPENFKMNLSGNLIVEGSIALNNGNLTVNGNVTQNSGSLNVENGILKVGGDYYAKQGTFNAGSGRTEIGGSFLAEKYNNLTCSKMDFYMKNDNAYMLVNGDFVIDRYYASSSDIIAGTLELKGNFTQRNSIDNYALNYDSKYAFRASGTHRVVFSGEEEQTIYFETPTYSYFNIVTIKNPYTDLGNAKYNYLYNEAPYVVNIITNTDKGVITKKLDTSLIHLLTEQIEEIGELEKADYVLEGWYLDEKFQTPLTEENNIVTKSVNVYAKWEFREGYIVSMIERVKAKVVWKCPKGNYFDNAVADVWDGWTSNENAGFANVITYDIGETLQFYHAGGTLMNTTVTASQKVQLATSGVGKLVLEWNHKSIVAEHLYMNFKFYDTNGVIIADLQMDKNYVDATENHKIGWPEEGDTVSLVAYNNEDGDTHTNEYYVNGFLTYTEKVGGLIDGFKSIVTSDGRYNTKWAHIGFANLAIATTSRDVAKIGDVYYENLTEAIDSAKDNDIVELCMNTCVNELIVLDKHITIDIYGYILTGNIRVGANTDLIICDSSEEKTGKVSGDIVVDIKDDEVLTSILTIYDGICENVQCGNLATIGTGEGFKVYRGEETGASMTEGAQVRIGEGVGADGKIAAGSGLRFATTVNRNDSLVAEALEHYNAETKQYDAGYEIGVKISAEGSDAVVYIPATLWQSEGDVFTSALTNIEESNYNRKFTATAYVTVEGVCYEVMAGTTRSIYQVAAGLLTETYAESEIESERLIQVLNAYVNQTGIRLVMNGTNGIYDVHDENSLSDKGGKYTGNAFFEIGGAKVEGTIYTVTIKPIGVNTYITVESFAEYLRINNNNSQIRDYVKLTNNGDNTYTLEFDYGAMTK